MAVAIPVFSSRAVFAHYPAQFKLIFARFRQPLRLALVLLKELTTEVEGGHRENLMNLPALTCGERSRTSAVEGFFPLCH